MNDATDFEAFVRRYQDMVYATAVRLLGNREEAEDAAQTVFLRAFQHFGAIGGSPSAGGWLRTVTRNVCLNHLSRHRSRWRLFSEMAEHDGRGEAEVVEQALQQAAKGTLEDEIDMAALRQRLEAALRELPDHQRVPLVLFHFEQISYDEIARVLSVSIGKVKTDIHRGREALRPLLKALMPHD